MFTAFPMSFMARCPERNSCTKRCRRVQVAIRKTGSPECKPLSAWQLRRLQLVSIDIFLRFTAMFEKLLWPNTHIIWGSVAFFKVFLAFCFTFIFLDGFCFNAFCLRFLLEVFQFATNVLFFMQFLCFSCICFSDP